MHFATEDGLLTCTTEASERDVFTFFRKNYVPSTELTAESNVLFRVTVEDGTKTTKPVHYIGVAHTTSFDDVLAHFDRKFATSGAFLLKGGYGVRPTQSAGQIFMKFGYDLNYHPKVDLSRVAWAQR
uniref:Ubiquitin-fold modifier 1 n=1 Tax=Haptolina brevifila TaxID=156173 RepID=A0A7S2MIW8_9EUKA|mmetsp:Transcript_52977/g.105286  ORF Transcript_52977/g.105286 Transcript_52977/m.105286 type:complete len:127 (+) Transcript_52977:114-494(+)|eukprot:CAMPEP_0174718692 /NCGR_PEP_ID=MMETSP1094-20130205/29734_1 /TAXON_ID=156173 /ORGANISM="Chrysochromulina brevifilum, Strain UTEX LB 985" /LENGTH=126 /DNA_ID=CAMNT_0015918857 /DNA_START=113 /DNA_END=493 /DNA_ORIENTATION=-